MDPAEESEDYSLDPESGLWVFSSAYLMKRGYCCGLGCRNCPYVPKNAPTKMEEPKKSD